MLARNANPAATFVALVYQTARTLLRRMQDDETTGGTQLWLNGGDGYGPVWVFHLYLEDGDMLFVPAGTCARQEEWPDYDLDQALTIKWLEINAPWCDGKAARHLPAEIVTLLQKHPDLRAQLHRLANSDNSDCELHTPSDGIVLF